MFSQQVSGRIHVVSRAHHGPLIESGTAEKRAPLARAACKLCPSHNVEHGTLEDALGLVRTLSTFPVSVSTDTLISCAWEHIQAFGGPARGGPVCRPHGWRRDNRCVVLRAPPAVRRACGWEKMRRCAGAVRHPASGSDVLYAGPH